ncbi:MAG TPA: histidine phosphatase family protein [Natronosporangium sp.]
MADGTRVLLTRHGQTAWHQPERYAGSSDIPLDEVGVAQAKALARRAAGIAPTTLACSPLVRATATAAPVAEATELPVRVDDRLRELDFGMAEGRSIASLREQAPDTVARFLVDPATHHFPGGEPPVDGARRVSAAVRELVDTDPGGTILVIFHGTLLRLLLCTLLGIPLRDYRRRFPRVDSVALTELRYPADPAAMVGLISYNAPITGLA